MLTVGLLLLGQLLLGLHRLEHLTQGPPAAACELCALGAGDDAPVPAARLCVLPDGYQVLTSLALVEQPPLLRP